MKDFLAYIHSVLTSLAPLSPSPHKMFTGRCTQISVTLLSCNCITRVIFAGMLQTSRVICSGIRKPLTPMFMDTFP